MADIVSPAPWRAFDANGNPVAAAEARFYRQGTTTPLTVYSDEAGLTPHPVPLLADANGIFPTVFDTSAFNVKVEVKHPTTGALLPGYPVDFARMASTATGSAASLTFSPTSDIPMTDVQSAIVRVQANWIGAKTGDAAGLVSGTAGTAGNLASWNVDGDLVEGPGFLDENDMSSDSATAVSSQQSIKAYVDTQVASVPTPIKAWVNFNGTGTVAIRSSFNVSSVTDNGQGDYTINFTDAMPDANYAIMATVGRGGGASAGRIAFAPHGDAPTTTSVRVSVSDNGGTLQDSEFISVAIIR